jgi:hypothetical protein
MTVFEALRESGNPSLMIENRRPLERSPEIILVSFVYMGLPSFFFKIPFSTEARKWNSKKNQKLLGYWDWGLNPI